MLTQSMPAIVRALQGVLPPAAVKQLTQALGNCSQPLTHRGNVNIQPFNPLESGGPGAYGGGQWNVNEYGDLIQQDSQAFYDLPGYSSDWNAFNFGGDNFYFPTSQNFSIVNNFAPGTTALGGETITERIFTREIVFLGPPGENGIDGLDGRDGREGLPGLSGGTATAGADGQAGAAGAAGAPGARGRSGFSGRPGDPGAAGAGGRDGNAGRNGRDGLYGLPGLNGRDGRDGRDAQVKSKTLRYLGGANPRVAETKAAITYPTNAIKDLTLSGGELSLTTDTVGIPTTFTLNEDCSITAGGAVDITFVTGVTITPVTGTPVAADTVTKDVLTKAKLEGVVPLNTSVATP